MANYLNFSYEQLKQFSEDAFRKFGFTDEESRIIVDILLTSDLYGIDSHGVQRLSRYHKSIEKGMIDMHAKPVVVSETPVSAVIDGQNGMGQLVAYDAMKLAIKKAKESGMAMVTVRHSNHYGIAGYYAKMACDEGLIGVSMTNTKAIMVPTFGRLAMLGSNPIAVAMPAEPYPFFFDSSTTVVTRGKLELYNKLDKPLPEGWAMDATGHGSSDASDVLKNIIANAGGGILPLGGEFEQTGSHKGYGYGMVCEIFTAILSMGLTSNHTYQGKESGVCHGFMAIDPAVFGDPSEIKQNLSAFLEELRQSPKAENADRIYTHGEKEYFACRERMEKGIDVDENTVSEMIDLCHYLDMDVERYLGSEAAAMPWKQSDYQA